MTNIKFTSGYSIELQGFKLKSSGQYDSLPLYEVVEGFVTAIAIVDDPAIDKHLTGDSETRIVSGVVMIPDLPIFRTRGLNGIENCYWYFSKTTISNYQKTFDGKLKIGH